MRGARICPGCKRIRVACSYAKGSRLCKPCRMDAAKPPKICTRCDHKLPGKDFMVKGIERKNCSLCRLKRKEDAERRARG